MNAKSKITVKTSQPKTKSRAHNRKIPRGEGNERVPYLTNLINHISDTLISTDMESAILKWNLAAESMYGWTAAEMRPMSVNQPAIGFIGGMYETN